MKNINPSKYISDWNSLKPVEKFLWVLIITYSLFQSVVLVLIFINHMLGPDIQRGAMFEAVNRLVMRASLYPPPSIEYVGMVHNPLFPVLGAIFTNFFGESMATLRFVAILGAVGSWLLIFFIVKNETNSWLGGLVAFGLFAASYLTFDGYIDYANADSWLLFCSLAGMYILSRSKGPAGWFFGIVILSLSFWFKQHGAIIAIAGLVYLTLLLRQKAILYWVLAFVLVPALYYFVGPWLFGEKFFYYTLIVPGRWSVFDYYTVDRILKYFVKHWAVLGLIGLNGVWSTIKTRSKPNIWVITLPFAFLIGLLGSLDPGSENNQYIIPGVWLIIWGVMQFCKLITNKHDPLKIGHSRISSLPLIQVLILLAFLQNYYHIPDAFFPKTAWNDYNDLIAYIHSLDGDVYMPGVGQLPAGVHLRFTAPWVQLGDLIRGTGEPTSTAHPLIRSILADVIEPDGKVYIITESPLEQDPVLGFLSKYYVQVDDLGDKYKSLRAVPGRFQRGWLRYVYVNK